MGKVLNGFLHGSPGAVSRSVDDIIIALPNQDEQPLSFGTAVVLSSQGTGAVRFTPSSTAADFLGFTARSASKTPAEYGSSQGSYQPREMMDVLTRGSIVVQVTGSPAAGGKVYLVKATGAVTVTADGDNTVELANARFRGPRDSTGQAEVILLSRNKQ